MSELEERSGMSIDHSVVMLRPDRDPLFAHVKAGMTVIIEDNGDWWMADVIPVIGNVRNPKLPSFFSRWQTWKHVSSVGSRLI